jgi:hypothetical protein
MSLGYLPQRAWFFIGALRLLPQGITMLLIGTSRYGHGVNLTASAIADVMFFFVIYQPYQINCIYPCYVKLRVSAGI